MIIIPLLLSILLRINGVGLIRILRPFNCFGLLRDYQILLFLIILFRTIIAQLGARDANFLEKSKILNILILMISFGRLFMLQFRNPILIYIIFELTRIPIFVIIIGWGYQPEKIKAAYIILIYTTVSAVPLLILLLIKINFSQRVRLTYIPTLINLNTETGGRILAIMMFLGFIVKIPLYGLHFWLPIAHVEAPVYASMILASILLKLGGIGLLRFNSRVYNYYILDFFRVLSLWGSIIVGFICLTTSDLKKIIAYTRVAHISFTIIIWCISRYGWFLPFIITLITHAFSSSGLFYRAHVIYKGTNSRILLINRGRMSSRKSFTFYWLILVIARVGAPPSVNLLTEILSLTLIRVRLCPLLILIIIIVIGMRAVHFILYRTVSHSYKTWDSINRFIRISVIDYRILMLHFLIILISPLIITFITM